MIQHLVNYRNYIIFLLPGFIALLTVFLQATHAHANNLPDIGNSAELMMSPEDEKRIGLEFMRQVRHQLKLEEDVSSNEYIQQLGDKLASQIDTRGQTFTFFIISDSSINAFAGPGGFIGVHTGLIQAAKTEGELASVLAHEISHVVQRHLLRSMESSKNMSLATFGAIVAAMILGGEVGEAVFASTIAGTTQNQLSYSRAHEQEADRVGIEMLARAQYDPNDMPNFFETLHRRNRFSHQDVPELLLTHPVTTSRIADTRARVASYKKLGRSDSLANKMPHTSSASASRFDLIKARLEILTETVGSEINENILTKTNKTENRKTNQLTLYRAGLRHYQRGNYKKARTQFETLLQQEPLRILYLAAGAENEIADKQYAKAINLLKEPLLTYPNNLARGRGCGDCRICPVRRS